MKTKGKDTLIGSGFFHQSGGKFRLIGSLTDGHWPDFVPGITCSYLICLFPFVNFFVHHQSRPEYCAWNPSGFLILFLAQNLFGPLPPMSNDLLCLGKFWHRWSSTGRGRGGVKFRQANPEASCDRTDQGAMRERPTTKGRQEIYSAMPEPPRYSWRSCTVLQEYIPWRVLGLRLGIPAVMFVFRSVVPMMPA